MWLTFFLVYFLISATLHGFGFFHKARRRTVVSVVSIRPVSDDQLQHCRTSSSFGLGTGNWVLTTVSAPSKFYGQAERAISTGKLHVSPHFHILPINQVVYLGPS